MTPHPLTPFRFCPRCGSQSFNERNEKAKFCMSCGFVYYFNPSAACVAVIENQCGEILVARRAKDPACGTLDLPGGFVDCFETAEQSVIREVKEETGLSISAPEYLFSLPNIYPYYGFDVHTVDLFYRCRITSTAQVIAADDVSELFWIAPEALNAADFGLLSIRKGIPLLKKMLPLST